MLELKAHICQKMMSWGSLSVSKHYREEYVLLVVELVLALMNSQDVFQSRLASLEEIRPVIIHRDLRMLLLY
jgi:hypothetical protein